MFKNPLSPQPTDDGAYGPSKLALRLATSDVTDYEKAVDAEPAAVGQKILMICTEERNMTMANGKNFSTGNHPVEMLLPMMHLTDAGFEIDVVTPTGAPVKIEMWAMPEKDDAVMAFYSTFEERFENPGSVAEFASRHLDDPSPYVAAFLPGGHGAMLGLPENEDVGKIIRWCHDRDLHMLAICHGPAALLAADLPDSTDPSRSTASGGSFVYDGYQIARVSGQNRQADPANRLHARTHALVLRRATRNRRHRDRQPQGRRHLPGPQPLRRVGPSARCQH